MQKACLSPSTFAEEMGVLFEWDALVWLLEGAPKVYSKLLCKLIQLQINVAFNCNLPINHLTYRLRGPPSCPNRLKNNCVDVRPWLCCDLPRRTSWDTEHIVCKYLYLYLYLHRYVYLSIDPSIHLFIYLIY